MPLTLEDIASYSGVSRSTVSRVINGDSRVKGQTREHVLEVIQRLNYRPNLAARSLAAGNARILGVLIPMSIEVIFSDPFFPNYLKGIMNVCNEKDYLATVWLIDTEDQQKSINPLLNNGGLLNGLIFHSIPYDSYLIEEINKSRVPYIQTGRTPNCSANNYVDVANRESAYKIVSHLISTGRKRIATIRGPQNLAWGADRFLGYQDALSAHHYPLDMDLVADGKGMEGDGYRAMQQLIPQHPDALFATNDVTAIGAMRCIKDAGLRIPQDIAVAGFDDIPFASLYNPPLTTMRQPSQKLGSTAAENLIDMILNPTSEPRQIILPTELVIRASSVAGSEISVAAIPDAVERH